MNPLLFCAEKRANNTCMNFLSSRSNINSQKAWNQSESMISLSMCSQNKWTTTKFVSSYKSFIDIQANVIQDTFFKWLDSFQSQLIVVSSQINWTQQVEAAIEKGEIDSCLEAIENQLNILADSVLQGMILQLTYY